MSMNNLSIDGELRYVIQWFNEWSELQRDDFVPVFVEYLLKDATTAGVYMNGIVNSLTATNVTDKPMSLFQCRIKLFRQWNPKWPYEFKDKLKQKICEIDPKVGEKISNALNEQNNENGLNGFNETTTTTDAEVFDAQVDVATTAQATTIDSVEVNNAKPVIAASAPADVVAAAVTVAAATTITSIDTTPLVAPAADITSIQTEAVDVDSNIAAVLRNETPVDDEIVQVNNNEVQDNITRVTVNAVDNDNDVTVANTYAVEPVEQVQHVTNTANIAVTVSVTTNPEVPLVA